MKPLIAVDVDDVVADLIGEWLRVYNYRYDDRLTADDITSWSISAQTTKCTTDELFAIIKEPAFYEGVIPCPRARNGIYALLAAGYRVIYATSCTPGSEQAKNDWLVKWGFLTDENRRRDFVAVTDKSLVRADFLFDDRIENVETFKGQGVLVRRPHNSLEAWRCPVQVRGMEDALGFLNQL